MSKFWAKHLIDPMNHDVHQPMYSPWTEKIHKLLASYQPVK